jgi:hypothetical protein
MNNLVSTTTGVASDRVGRMALMTYTCLEGKKRNGGISLQLLSVLLYTLFSRKNKNEFKDIDKILILWEQIKENKIFMATRQKQRLQSVLNWN